MVLGQPECLPTTKVHNPPCRTTLGADALHWERDRGSTGECRTTGRIRGAELHDALPRKARVSLEERRHREPVREVVAPRGQVREVVPVADRENVVVIGRLGRLDAPDMVLRKEY